VSPTGWPADGARRPGVETPGYVVPPLAGLAPCPPVSTANSRRSLGYSPLFQDESPAGTAAHSPGRKPRVVGIVESGSPSGATARGTEVTRDAATRLPESLLRPPPDDVTRPFPAPPQLGDEVPELKDGAG